MRIMYDFQMLVMQKYGGVTRYFYEIASNIVKNDDVSVSVPVIFSWNYYFEGFLGKKSVNRYFPKSMKFVLWLNKWYTLKNLKRNQYDIVHPTYFDPYIISKSSAKLVVTVHDMIHELFPEFFARNDKTVENKKKMIFAADRIIAVSENTKRDILRFYPEIGDGKIAVIYHGAVERKTGIDKPISLELPEHYILYVGSRDIYKNFKTFLEAMEKVFARYSGLNIVCAGGGAFSGKEKELISDVGLSDRIMQIQFSDDGLMYAYSKAACFVFPSKYEGFGIPVLEAFQNGCPVALSNSSSLPEVGGDAAVYFEPDSAEDMAQKVGTLVGDLDMRKELVLRGKEQLKKFSWELAAKKTLEVYREL